jgi:type IV pilus assembly protein PilY1
MKSKKLFHSAMIGGLALFLSATNADDTDIYFQPAGSGASAEPLVMLTLDWRSNLGNTLCFYGTDCAGDLGTDINDKLVFFNTAIYCDASDTVNCPDDDSDALVPTSDPDLDGEKVFASINLSDGDDVTTFDVLRAVYGVLFDEIAGVKVGMMLNHDGNSPNCDGPSETDCSNGAYVLSGYNSFEADDANGAKLALLRKMFAVPTPQGDGTPNPTSHDFQGAELYFELFRYLTGQAVHNGHNGWVDYASDDSENLDTEDPLRAWDVTIESNGSYISPLNDADECAKLFAINLMFQVSNKDTDSHNAIDDAESSGGMGFRPRQGSNAFPDVIAYTHEHDLGSDAYPSWDSNSQPAGNQNLISYFIVKGGSQGAFNVATEYAEAGGTGTPLVWEDSVDGLQALLDQLREVFKSILSVSTTFVSAAVPVNVFNQADLDENIFVALFAVDPDGNPFWSGNLKKLKLLEYIDALGVPRVRVIDSLDSTNSAVAADNRIRYDALSFWSKPNAMPAPPDPATLDQDDERKFMVANRDGRFVPRGGAGQILPGFIDSTTSPDPGNPGKGNTDTAASTLSIDPAPRKMFTEPVGAVTAGSNGMVPLDTVTGANIGTINSGLALEAAVQSMLGVSNADEADTLLRWARGYAYLTPAATVDALADGENTELARDWIMADVIHSRPLPLNYGARGSFTAINQDVRILMGTNDGLFRMIQNIEPSGAESGKENWAFMPHESFPILKTLASNQPGQEPPHPYGVDGQAVALVKDVAGDASIDHTVGDKAYVYFGMRRGGDTYYGMDVSNPDAPELMWKIEKDSDDFYELGMTFSTPTVAKVKYGDGNLKDVLIFGGGYYGGWSGSDRVGYDSDDVPTLSSLSGGGGNAIYMVDAVTGALIWKAVDDDSSTSFSHAYVNSGMNHSIPSEITVVDSNGDDIDDRAYVGDMGGNIWRIDFPRSDAVGDSRDAEWQVVKLASLGGTDANDRRFFHKPDVVVAVRPDQNTAAFDAVMIGSGNRAAPKSKAVDDYFYAIRDRNGRTPPDPSHPTNPWTPITQGDLAVADCYLTYQPQTTGCDTGLSNGWSMKLDVDGEKLFSRAITENFSIFFSTYLPDGEPDSSGSTQACSLAEGSNRLYGVNVFTGRPVQNSNQFDDGGNVDPSSEPDRIIYKGVGPGTDPEIYQPGMVWEGLTPHATGGSSYWKTFWYEKNVDR